jgi:SAC3 family protein LENG8/THP3
MSEQDFQAAQQKNLKQGMRGGAEQSAGAGAGRQSESARPGPVATARPGRQDNRPAWMTQVGQGTPQPAAAPSQHRNPNDFCPPASRPQTVEKEARKVVAWPDGLKRYVERNFEQCKTDEQKVYVQSKLKPFITNAVNKGTLNYVDWDKTPTILEEERSVSRGEKRSRGNDLESAYCLNIKAYLEATPGHTIKLSQIKLTVPMPKKLQGKKKLKLKGMLESSSVPFVISGSGGGMEVGLPGGKRAYEGGGESAGKKRRRVASPSRSQSSGRVSDFSNLKRTRRALIVADAAELSKRRARAGRFTTGAGNSESRSVSRSQGRAAMKQNRKIVRMLRNIAQSGGDVDWDLAIVRGSCENLEKDYFRLTSQPDPATVRPERVLREAVEAVRKKWEKKTVSYEWANNQLKAIRQDITVQHIRNNFVVQVYEMHTRICLENEDIMEVNQCLTKVFELYKEGHSTGNCDEFTAYRILYLVYTNEKYSEGAADLILMMPGLLSEVGSSVSVRHAMAVQEAVSTDSFRDFFVLHENAPNMNCNFTNFLVDCMRWKGLRTLSKSFRHPSLVPIAFLVKVLGYKDEPECVQDLKSHRAVLKKENGPCFDAAASLPVYSKGFMFKVLDGDSVDDAPA